MTNQTEKAKAIFSAAIERYTPQQWPTYLDGACHDDAPLRAQVEELLQAHAEMGSFHDAPSDHVEVTQDIPALSERPGTEIGPYKLLQSIGEGGMGVVYMAEQSEPVGRRVALKIIKPGMDTRQVIARFEAERQALAMMDHPNIAKVHDAGATDSGRPYFVMELVKGIPITKYCDQQHLTPRQRLDLFIPVCQAVQHAHQKGVIHRDIKPSNVLVALYDGQAVPKVIDFGVAKATSQRLTDKTMFTELGQVIGTLEYMSPEQAQVNQLDIDTRSDIYSLGVLLYELLVGTTPFDRRRLQSAAFDEMLRIIREEEPPRPSLRLSTIETLPAVAANRQIEPQKMSTLLRRELDWIVMKALEKDRARRYETATGLAADIRRYLDDDPVQACPPSAAYRVRKFVRRHRAPITTGVIVALALVVGLISTSVMAVKADRAKLAAEEAKLAADQARQRADEDKQRAVAAMKRVESELREKASFYAMNGERDNAEQVVLDALIVGADEAWAEEIRGMAATFAGEPAAAEEHLIRALELGNGSVAVHVLLGELNATLPHDRRVAHLQWAELQTPKTDADHLLRARIRYMDKPQESYETADRIFEARRSPLALFVRARAAQKLAYRRGSLQFAGESVKDMIAVRRLTPNNDLVISNLFYSLGAAVEIARHTDDEQAVQYYRLLGQLTFKELEPPYPIIFGLEYFFATIGDFETFELLLKLSGQRFSSRKLLYAQQLFFRGEEETAKRVIEAYAPAEDDKFESNVREVRYATLLAEFPDRRKEARELLIAGLQKQQTGPALLYATDDTKREKTDSEIIKTLQALNRIGFGDDAEREAGRFVGEQRAQGLTVSPTILYYAGQIDDETLLQRRQNDSRLKEDAHWVIALRYFGQHDLDNVKKHLNLCVDRPSGSLKALQARGLLRRLERDPDWPHWITNQQ